MKNNNNAFTLIELSIVLIIIGMIVAGITGGKALIHTSELQSVISDIDRYKVAYNNYKMQYDALPGDHRNAMDYWSGAVGNGNGNGKISYPEGGQEDFLAWKHLYLAGLIPESMSGKCSGSYEIGRNMPEASFKNTGYQIHHTTVYGKSENHIQFSSTVGIWFGGAAVTPRDASSIDKKIDDGKADGGKIYTTNAKLVAGCTTGNKNDSSGDYILSSSAKDCRMYFWLD